MTQIYRRSESVFCHQKIVIVFSLFPHPEWLRITNPIWWVPAIWPSFCRPVWWVLRTRIQSAVWLAHDLNTCLLACWLRTIHTYFRHPQAPIPNPHHRITWLSNKDKVRLYPQAWSLHHLSRLMCLLSRKNVGFFEVDHRLMPARWPVPPNATVTPGAMFQPRASLTSQFTVDTALWQHQSLSVFVYPELFDLHDQLRLFYSKKFYASTLYIYTYFIACHEAFDRKLCTCLCLYLFATDSHVFQERKNRTKFFSSKLILSRQLDSASVLIHFIENCFFPFCFVLFYFFVFTNPNYGFTCFPPLVRVCVCLSVFPSCGCPWLVPEVQFSIALDLRTPVSFVHLYCHTIHQTLTPPPQVR